MTATTHHPRHDLIAASMRSFYATAAPEADYRVVEEWFGRRTGFGGELSTVYLEIDDPRDLPAAVSDIPETAMIRVTDRAKDGRLREALNACGWLEDQSATYLALVRPLRPEPVPAGLTVETVGDDPELLRTWAAVRIQAFADSEERPNAEELAGELHRRTRELSISQLWLARLEGEPVAVLDAYDLEHELVFILATRLPFRHLGIARHLLALRADGKEPGDSRNGSITINAREGGRPEALYRRLGFDDEVYWYRQYRSAEV